MVRIGWFLQLRIDVLYLSNFADAGVKDFSDLRSDWVHAEILYPVKTAKKSQIFLSTFTTLLILMTYIKMLLLR